MSTTIFLLIAAPGQVGNLRVLFNSTGSSFDRVTRMYTLVIEIVWNVPVNPNGVITSYEVTVTQTDNSSVIIYSDNVTVTSESMRYFRGSRIVMYANRLFGTVKCVLLGRWYYPLLTTL